MALCRWKRVLRNRVGRLWWWFGFGRAEGTLNRRVRLILCEPPIHRGRLKSQTAIRGGAKTLVRDVGHASFHPRDRNPKVCCKLALSQPRLGLAGWELKHVRHAKTLPAQRSRSNGAIPPDTAF